MFLRFFDGGKQHLNFFLKLGLCFTTALPQTNVYNFALASILVRLQGNPRQKWRRQAGFRSPKASNELSDAYRRENGYFGELMNWINVIEQILGGIMVVYL
ncbi:hypothetical protein LOZ80_21085 [Paenibacillus sp. HWE-109]|uniref:hypothetical protein n=1 Tax=Paenibacillus sp. HWE-109 TaxID=1306526 RepID=UPI001EE10D56|nr:hypothetical protein [Paenibacillus sp. HWE-109]UKS24127.1 hypothetical protein LOZ80_21085 [Paenibacillus sp. HWE-109]